VLRFINPILGNRYGPGVIPLQGTWGGRILTLHLNYDADYTVAARNSEVEREEFIIRQPPIGDKDDYHSENSWISDGLPSSSRRRRGDIRGEGGEWREKRNASRVDIGVDSAKSEIKVEKS